MDRNILKTLKKDKWINFLREGKNPDYPEETIFVTNLRSVRDKMEPNRIEPYTEYPVGRLVLKNQFLQCK